MIRRPAVWLLLALAAVACSPREQADGEARVAPGDGIWFLDGVAPGEDISASLSSANFTRVLLPAGRLSASGAGWTLTESPSPGAPAVGLFVHLVYTVDGLSGTWKSRSEADFDRIAESISTHVRGAIDSKTWGSVAGVHLDAPIPSDAAEQAGMLLTRLRARLPEALLLSATLGPLSGDKEASEALAELPVDAYFATVFGDDALDPAAVDALGRPWWAGYDPGATGALLPASGGGRESVDESVFSALTDDPHVEIMHDISLSEVGSSGFVFRIREPIAVGTRRLVPGDRVTFRQPALTELIYRFGADSAAKRHMRGRVLRLSGAAEAGRIVTLSALADVLLGRPLDPDPLVTIVADDDSLTVGVENASAHASLVSRTGNWVEVDVPTGGIADVDPGGFDRFEVFDAAGRPVTLARATRVKLYEALLSPREVIAPARLALRNPPPTDCCAQRSQVLSAAGPELKTDWLSPTPVPTRTPKPKAARR